MWVRPPSDNIDYGKGAMASNKLLARDQVTGTQAITANAPEWLQAGTPMWASIWDMLDLPKSAASAYFGRFA